MQARLARRQEADADIQVAGEQAPLDVDSRQFVDLHPQMRLRGVQAFDHVRHQAGVDRLQYADRQAARGLPAEYAHRLAGPFQSLQQRYRMVVQGVGGDGRQQALAAALEQRDVEVLLQLADLLREGRLRQGQAFGGAADVAFLVERDEIAELAKIHKLFLSMKLENRNGVGPA